MGRENRMPGVAVLPQGLEEAGSSELDRLGAGSVRPLRRAAAFEADMACLYRLHLQARLPFRLLREMGRFPCCSRDELYDGIQHCLDFMVRLCRLSPTRLLLITTTTDGCWSSNSEGTHPLKRPEPET